MLTMALKFAIILQNLKTTNHRRSGKSKYDHKLTEIDVVYVTTELKLGQKKKYVCFLFHPVKSLGRVGRLSFFFLTFFIT